LAKKCVFRSTAALKPRTNSSVKLVISYTPCCPWVYSVVEQLRLVNLTRWNQTEGWSGLVWS
jgi:hypothetical protein